MKIYLKKIFSISLILLAIVTNAQNINGNWTIKGPIVFPPNISGQINGMGRVSQIKFHPTNSQKMYAVSSSGGLFTSNDAGVNWNKTGTDTKIPTSRCASICVDYTNDNILYLSTGDANYYYTEYGIYKSIDGGVNWNASNTSIGNRMALEILISPNNNNTILAATNDGIWKSNDAGKTWNIKKAAGEFTHMIYKPNSTNTIYASTKIDFWKSTNDGDSWTKIITINPVDGRGGRIAVSVANPNKVYVGFAGTSQDNPQGGIIYESNNSGDTFVLKKGDNQPNLNGYDPDGKGQGNFNWFIFADRINADVLYACGHVVWKSTDAGTNWTKLTNWYENCHTDMHEIKSSPYDNNKLFNVNDGGIFTSTNGGSLWKPSSDGLSATEILRSGHSKLSRNIMSIGTQDNGRLYLDGNIWKTNGGGDYSSKTSFDYSQPSVAYFHVNARKKNLVTNSNEDDGSYGIQTPENDDNYVFSNLNTSFGLISQKNVLKKTANLLTANPTWTNIKTFTSDVKCMTVSPANINEIYVVLNNDEIYYSSNGSSFNKISNTPTATPNDNNDYNLIEVNKNDSNIVYLTCRNKIYRSTNKGVNWTDISGGLLNANIIGLLHNPYKNDESFYLSTPFGVYYKNITMTDWKSFSSGLPTIAPITDLMSYFDGTSKSVLRVAFEGRGVWESDLYSESTLSNNKFEQEVGSISIYPNPSTDIITLNITNPELMGTKAILFDMTGKQITEIKIDEPVTLLDFKKYSKGIYIIKFSNNLTKKIIVK